MSSSPSFMAACIQMNSQNDMDTNIKNALTQIHRAHERGATFITTPENLCFMAAQSSELIDHAYPSLKHPALKAFTSCAAELKCWLLIGSLTVKPNPFRGKMVNRSYLIDPNGRITMRYDKIHLYDASVQHGESHHESKLFRPGRKAKLAKTPLGNIGLTVCYDVRFPFLYRKLCQAGAHIICVPSAFTKITGQAHWETLLKARAIENGCYIIAPAQCGNHPNNRQTYGHSMIIDPWGTVLAEASDGNDIITASIDTATCTHVREQIPSLYAQDHVTVDTR